MINIGKIMKKILLSLSLSSFILTACSNPTDNTSHSTENVPPHAPNTSTETPPVTSPDPIHNAQNSLDWQGTYKGIFPCADCEGIEIELKLNADHSYELEEKYKGKEDGKAFKSKGTFNFDATGSLITLDKDANERKFFVGENVIEARDIETGQKIEGPLAEHYKLAKELD